MIEKTSMDVETGTEQREVRIEYMRLDEIQRDPDNPKDHDLSALAESLERFGFVSPMGINEKTGKLLWGHGRLDDLVAFMDEGKPLLDGIQVDDDGMWKAPVVRGVHLNSIDGTAYVITDNRQVELGGWNEPKLVETLIRIAGGDGLGLRGTGFDGDDVDTLIRLYRPDLIDMPEDPGPQINKAEELQKKYGTAIGQIWELGDHRLAVGDCTDKAVIDAIMMGEKAKSVVTDPPYGIGVKGVIGDDTNLQELEAFNNKWLRMLPEIMQRPSLLISFSSTRTFPALLDPARQIGWDFLRWLTLYKRTDRSYPWRGWLLISEGILLFQIGQGNPFTPTREGSEVQITHDTYLHERHGLEIPEWEERGMWHPTIKPLWVVQDLVGKSALQNEIIYDPFLGSGTTIIACEHLDRRCRTIEIDPGYCAIAIQRWVDMVGLEPRLMIL